MDKKRWDFWPWPIELRTILKILGDLTIVIIAAGLLEYFFSISEHVSPYTNRQTLTVAVIIAILTIFLIYNYWNRIYEK